ncbi:Oidioi.mRNA.OKI2018_I69.PAR.g10548.t1.cds [Oikopleura dioica]|uniref:Oidioi.mRNA.OKI2018_I69.PAR.g10548.t1.cds n=1 Tax=Oikopleura dioica TaxID=34765 RepID=A0ABN7RUA5_OIKDI|nr:Oidioi.mRNA.OKI2018_I69.PAR.g10548.t1.cds [Oikopleura dioica]
MDFTESVAKLKSVPRYAGSKEQPHLFYITEGVQKTSINYHLQYGRGDARWNMHVRACSAKAAILQCSSADSKVNPCKGTAKIEILDPKLIIVERKENVKKPRNVFKLNYDHPDVKDIKKYGKVTTTRDHCKSCKPSLRYHVIQREFRSNNGKKLVVKVRDDNFNFDHLQEILLKCKKRGNWARGLSITGISLSTIAGFVVLFVWIINNSIFDPQLADTDPANGPYPSPFDGQLSG